LYYYNYLKRSLHHCVNGQVQSWVYNKGIGRAFPYIIQINHWRAQRTKLVPTAGRRGCIRHEIKYILYKRRQTLLLLYTNILNYYFYYRRYSVPNFRCLCANTTTACTGRTCTSWAKPWPRCRYSWSYPYCSRQSCTTSWV